MCLAAMCCPAEHLGKNVTSTNSVPDCGTAALQVNNLRSLCGWAVANFLLFIEIILGVLGLIAVSDIRRRAGDTAAAVTGAASGLALFHGIYELSKKIGETRFTQAVSLLTASATFLFALKFFFVPASWFFERHSYLLWATPLLSFFAWSGPFAFFRFGFWALLALIWTQEIFDDKEIAFFLLGRPVVVDNQCPSPLSLRLASGNFLTKEPGELHSWTVASRTNSRLEVAAERPFRAYHHLTYLNASSGSTRWNGSYGGSSKLMRFEVAPEKDGSLQLTFKCQG